MLRASPFMLRKPLSLFLAFVFGLFVLGLESLCVQASTTGEAEIFRRWVPKEGAPFSAKLVNLRGGVVLLEQKNGSKKMLSLSALSQEDQEYAKQKYPEGTASITLPVPSNKPSVKQYKPQRELSAQPSSKNDISGGLDSSKTVTERVQLGLKNYQKGDRAPALNPRLQGTDKRTSIEELNKQGKWVLVHFWSVKDQNSMEQLPGVGVLYSKYKKKGLEVLGVAVAADNRSTLNFIENKYGVTWPDAQDSLGGISKRWGVVKVPHFVLISPSGYIVEDDIDPRELEGKVRQYVLGVR